MFGVTFLVNGAIKFAQPGVLVSFEETRQDIVANFASLGYGLEQMIADNALAIDYVRVARSEIEETGEYNLDGLFVRIGCAVEAIGAKRIVLDSIESLFSGFQNPAILRAELRRLVAWTKTVGLTAIITTERGDGQLTRHGLEEYVTDCVVLLDSRVEQEIMTRRLRVVKYRGSAHGTNEYPFLIDTHGISVMPVTSSGPRGEVSSEVVSSGVPGLDAMIRIGGFYRGASVLVSGVAGTGKTTLTTHFIDAACGRGERCMYFGLEESAAEIARNALSVGMDLNRWVAAGLLRFDATRPSMHGFEMHLARMHRDVQLFAPSIAVVDPISAFRGPPQEVHATLLRMVDMLKGSGITALFTSLRAICPSGDDGTETGLSSLMDSWIRLTDVDSGGERNRVMCIVKSRGTSHSSQMREYVITDAGIRIVDSYTGPNGVLTGTARLAQEARERGEAEAHIREVNRRGRENAYQRRTLERRIAELQAELDANLQDDEIMLTEDAVHTATLRDELLERTQSREGAD